MPLSTCFSRPHGSKPRPITSPPTASGRDHRRDRVSRVAAARSCASALCECGAPKPPAAEACPQCRWKDGASQGPAAIIAALRTAGGSAPREALELATGLSGRHILRLVHGLVAAGRVAREVRVDSPVAGRVRGRPVTRAWFRLSDRRRRDRGPERRSDSGEVSRV